MEGSFGCLLVQVKRLLDQSKCDLSDALLFLDSAIGSEEFIGCDNFGKLMRQLQRDHIDVFNISILQSSISPSWCVHAGTPTLQQLSKALKSLENWFVFGVKLAVPHSQLTKIKKSHHEGEIELCKIDMFQYWLDNKLVPTWNEVIRALEETDKVTLASQIKHDYLLSPASEEEGMQNACTGKNKFSDIMAKVQ